MARYEFTEGTSQKFWEITLQGASFTVRFGRQGTQGQTQEKSFASEDKARTEHDKLVAEKVKKGYSLVAGALAAAAVPVPMEPEAPGAAAVKGAKAQAKQAEVAPPAKEASPAEVSPPAEDRGPVQKWTPEELPTERVKGVYWTPALRHLLVPRPGGLRAVVRPVPSVEVAWAAVRRSFLAQDLMAVEKLKDGSSTDKPRQWQWRTSFSATERALAARFDSLTPRVGSETEDMALVRDLFVQYRYPANWFAESQHERVADFLVATVGLEQAILRSVRAMDDELPYTGVGLFARFRELLSLTDEATYRSLRATCLPVFASCAAAIREKDEGAANDLLSAASFLFPVGPWAGEEEEAALEAALEAVGEFGDLDVTHACVLSAGGAACLEAFCRKNRKVRHEFWSFDQSHRLYLTGLLELEGKGALEGLIKLQVGDPWEDDGHYQGLYCFVLAHIDDDAAIGTLIKHLKRETAEAPWATAALHVAAEVQRARVLRLLEAAGDKRAKAAALSITNGSSLPLTFRVRDVHAPVIGSGDDVHVEGVPVDSYVGTVPKEAKPYVRRSVSFRFTAEPAIVWRDEEERLGYLPSGDDGGGHEQEWDGKPLSKLDRAETEAYVAHLERYQLEVPDYGVGLLPRELVLRLVQLPYGSASYDFNRLGTWIARYGLDVLPWAMDVAAAAFNNALLPLGHLSLVPYFAAWFAGKKDKPRARAWLMRHPRIAAAGCLSLALDGSGAEQDAATRVLRYLASMEQRGLILELAAQGGAKDVAAVTALLDADPLAGPKVKKPELPAYASAAKLPALSTRDGRHLSAAEVDTLLVQLAFSVSDEPHPGVLHARETLTEASRAAFAWTLFEAWGKAKYDARHGWCLQAVGFLGDAECARKLTALAREWPGENASKRAEAALDALYNQGSETALVLINLLAEKSRFPAFKTAARERIDLLARRRGLTADELADRLVPTFGLDDAGGTVLDFGPRRFFVSFDETLRPLVRNDAGELLKDLPKPAKADAAAKAKDAAARFTGLKKDVRSVASLQVKRLERMLMSQRSVAAADFVAYFVKHPLVFHLTRRLLWAVVDGARRVPFRVAEDGTFATVKDDAFTLPADGRVVVAHPVHVEAAQQAAWGQVFADYELIAPFPQLVRPVFVPQATEKGNVCRRFQGAKVPTKALRGLESRRWSRDISDGGGISTYYCVVDRPNARPIMAWVHFEPGFVVGMDTEEATQTLGELRLDTCALQDLDPVVFSELMLDIERLKA
ncbi:DUF4132 domain-containing protein [Corallococcus sp. M34]|uniref:WGR and DUF4132 domain-containing protein n=1 Tax=Citreicoccus inhibens TaxID=2849499 RepID=UPI001C21DBBC|nr:DUF4132 domain-containing protein [Citreicoccus inhibens]MBU8898676.1 DUF4132 domain-containing protein [Citreicoccus inhibens]